MDGHRGEDGRRGLRWGIGRRGVAGSRRLGVSAAGVRGRGGGKQIRWYYRAKSRCDLTHRICPPIYIERPTSNPSKITCTCAWKKNRTGPVISLARSALLSVGFFARLLLRLACCLRKIRIAFSVNFEKKSWNQKIFMDFKRLVGLKMSRNSENVCELEKKICEFEKMLANLKNVSEFEKSLRV